MTQVRRLTISKLSFAAIDFETANASRGSACAVGISRVDGGEVVETVSWLMRPHSSVGEFHPRNISVHGIRPNDVIGAPGWGESLERILSLTKGLPLVAYNAPFDSSVLRKSSEVNGVRTPALSVLCALKLARAHVDLPHYKLNQVALALGVPDFAHHEAGADALACASVVLEIAARKRFTGDLLDLWNPGANSTAIPQRSAPRASGKVVLTPTITVDKKHLGPLSGQTIVFTRELVSMSRVAASGEATRLGAAVKASVTKATSIIVVGGEVTRWRPSLSDSTAKERAAKDLISAGQSIRLLSESDFLVLIGKPDPAQRDASKLAPAPIAMAEKSLVIVPLVTAAPGELEPPEVFTLVAPRENGTLELPPVVEAANPPLPLATEDTPVATSNVIVASASPSLPQFISAAEIGYREPLKPLPSWTAVRWWAWALVSASAGFFYGVVMTMLTGVGAVGGIAILLSLIVSLGLLVTQIAAWFGSAGDQRRQDRTRE